MKRGKQTVESLTTNTAESVEINLNEIFAVHER